MYENYWTCFDVMCEIYETAQKYINTTFAQLLDKYVNLNSIIWCILKVFESCFILCTYVKTNV